MVTERTFCGVSDCEELVGAFTGDEWVGSRGLNYKVVAEPRRQRVFIHPLILSVFHCYSFIYLYLTSSAVIFTGFDYALILFELSKEVYLLISLIKRSLPSSISE